MDLQRELVVFIFLFCILNKVTSEGAQVCGCNIVKCTLKCDTAGRLSTGCYKSMWSYATPRCNNVYSCRVVDYYNPKYEVHVLSSYEARTDHGFGYHPVGRADVKIFSSQRTGNSSRPLVLVLGSYEPVTWNIKGLSSQRIERVILISYYSAKSRITGVSSDKREINKTSKLRAGYGGDEPDTQEMLKYIVKRYGPITSFTGRYTANIWNLTVGVPINVTDALKSKRCAGLGVHPTYSPTRWYHHTPSVVFPTWNHPTWAHPTWNFHHTVENSNQYESSQYSVSIVVPFIIVAVIVVALVSIIVKCRQTANASRPRETGQRPQPRRGHQSSTDATIVVPPVRANGRSSPLHGSNTNGRNTARENRTLNSGNAPPIQFPVDSNLFSRAPPSYEDATAQVPLPTYEQAVGKIV